MVARYRPVQRPFDKCVELRTDFRSDDALSGAARHDLRQRRGASERFDTAGVHLAGPMTKTPDIHT